MTINAMERGKDIRKGDSPATIKAAKILISEENFFFFTGFGDDLRHFSIGPWRTTYVSSGRRQAVEPFDYAPRLCWAYGIPRKAQNQT